MKKSLFISAILTVFCMTALEAQQMDPALMALINEKDNTILDQKLKALSGSTNENDLELLATYYLIKDNKAKSDSIQNVALKLYPKGQTASRKALEQMYRETDVVKKEAMLAAYHNNFPKADMDQAYGAMVYTMARKMETCMEAVKYLDLIKDTKSRFTYAFHLGVNMASCDPQNAEKFLLREIEEFKDLENEGNDKEIQDQQKYFLGEMKYAYGKILFNKGQYGQALPYIKAAYENGASRDIDKNIQYARLLIILNDYQNAFPVLDQLVKSGKGNAELKKELETVYSKLHPGENGAAYVAEIENNVNAQIAEDFLKNLLDQPSPDFSVRDVDGKDVTLADFKGKTIVVDFWATWCGPCKKSFPAMQIVVNKYRNDPDVKFLFIHTWEQNDNPLSDAQAYLESHNYTFDLYIDPKDKTTNKNKAVELFGVKGIPQKFIIDGKGIIRFNVTGFDGGDDAAAEELRQMIEYTRRLK